MKDNPSPFMTGLSKLLPLMLEGSKDAPIMALDQRTSCTPSASLMGDGG
jgi:hypothetical protein